MFFFCATQVLERCEKRVLHERPIYLQKILLTDIVIIIHIYE